MAYWPAPQWVHSAALYVTLYLPIPQVSQELEIVLRYVPGVHAGVGDGVGEPLGDAVGAGVGINTHAVAPPTPAVQVDVMHS